VSQYPQLLYEYVGALQWDKAIRLCRHVRDRRVTLTLALPSTLRADSCAACFERCALKIRHGLCPLQPLAWGPSFALTDTEPSHGATCANCSCLWACLAAMAVHHKDLNTAELSFAAIDDMDKLQYIQHIKQIPSEEGRAAELALFRRRPEEAEAILLQVRLRGSERSPSPWIGLLLRVRVCGSKTSVASLPTRRREDDWLSVRLTLGLRQVGPRLALPLTQ
jgi:hypothetical protein